MVPIVQAPLPVVSTEYFSFGPNEGFSVQEFLRDLIRSSSHAAKTNFVPPDQEYVTHQGETLALPLILGNAAIPDQLQSSSTNVSNNRPSPLHQPPAPKGPVKRERNVLRVDSQLDRGVNTNLPRIVHTYSKKQKGIAQEQPERSREERPEKGKKRCRRAPVEGLVLIHRVSDQGAHPTEPQHEQDPEKIFDLDSDPVEGHPITSPKSRRRRPVRNTNSKPARKQKRSKVSCGQGNVDPKDFRIPQRLVTPPTNRGSGWTPGSGFSEFHVDSIGKRKCFKPKILKVKRSDPAPKDRGRTLDLTNRLDMTKSMEEPRVVRRERGPLHGKSRQEYGVLLFETTSTRVGERSRSFQHTRNADDTVTTEPSEKVASSVKYQRCAMAGHGPPSKIPSQRPSIHHSDSLSYQNGSKADHSQLATDDPKFQRSGWLKRAKRVGFAIPAGQIEPQDPTDGRLGDGLPHIVGDGATEVSDEGDKVNIERHHDKRTVQANIGFEKDDVVNPLETRCMDANTASEITICRRSVKISPSICNRNDKGHFKSQQKGATITDPNYKEDAGNVQPYVHANTPEDGWKIIERVSQGYHTVFQQEILDSNVLRSSRQGSRPNQASKPPELGPQSRMNRRPEVRETPSKSLFSGSCTAPKHTIVPNGELTITTNPLDPPQTPQIPHPTNSYLSHAIAQLNHPNNKQSSHTVMRRKSHISNNNSTGSAKVRPDLSVPSQGNLQLGVTPRLKRRMSRVPFVPPFKKGM